MSLVLQLFGVLCGILLIAATFHALFKRSISERQSLFWFFCSFVIIIACLFPGITMDIANFFGVAYAPSIIFMGVIILVIFGLFYCFTKISLLYSRNRELAIQVSMLNSENAQLREQFQKLQNEQKAPSEGGVDHK